MICIIFMYQLQRLAVPRIQATFRISSFGRCFYMYFCENADSKPLLEIHCTFNVLSLLPVFKVWMPQSKATLSA